MRWSHAAVLALVGVVFDGPPFCEVYGFIITTSVRLDPGDAAKFIENPLNSFRSLEVHRQAPFGEWSVESSYDSSAACEEARTAERAKSGWPSEEPEDIYLRLQSIRQYDSTCIATDDLRLAN
jgi:hypothetical protein